MSCTFDKEVDPLDNETIHDHYFFKIMSKFLLPI